MLNVKSRRRPDDLESSPIDSVQIVVRSRPISRQSSKPTSRDPSPEKKVRPKISFGWLTYPNKQIICGLLLTALLLSLIVLLHASSVSFTKVKPGDTYSVGNVTHVVPPHLRLEGTFYHSKEAELIHSVQFLEQVAQILNTHHVQWWADGGTLVGTMRHQGFVPWDDDMDIAVWLSAQDFLQGEEFQRDLRRRQLRLVVGDGLWRFVPAQGMPYPCVDVSFICSIPDGGVFFADGLNSFNSSSCFPGATRDMAKVHVSDIFPLATTKFEWFDMPVPRNAVKFLKRFFDKDVLDVGKEFRTNRRLVPWIFNHKYEIMLLQWLGWSSWPS